MVFNSFYFAIFFAIVVFSYFILPHRFRWMLLLAASCFFYMFFKPVFILIMGFTITIDYIAGITIEQAQNQRRKKTFLILSLLANIGILAVFKYFNFINGNITGLALLLGFDNPIPALNWILPIGLSFHTFQAMSYTIEVYRGTQKAERHFGIYSLYVMFFPQLVAGPIERPQNMLHQFYEKHVFNYDYFSSGMRLIMWGLFKKAVVADRLAIIADPIFTHPQEYSAVALVIACVFFSFQIYCDFSGYSDMAIGTARVLGFRLMKNFDRPYAASSVTEFWSRWHISLSTWFRDYLYIPLGGNRVPAMRKHINVFIVFLASGLWHGANWTYIVWGGLHGAIVVIEGTTRRVLDHAKRFMGWGSFKWLHYGFGRIKTFLLVTLAWVFFRAASSADALYILRKIQGVLSELHIVFINHKVFMVRYLSNVPVLKVLEGVAAILVLELVHFVQGRVVPNDFIRRQPLLIRWLIYYFFVFSILFFGVFNDRTFIYFQF